MKTNNTFLSYFVCGFLLMGVGLGQNQTSEIKVGVVLDLNTTFSKICLTSIKMAVSDFYADHPNYLTRLTLHVRDSMEDTVQASAAALDLIKTEQVSAIIGPINSMQADFMIKLANKTQVPTITFSATSPLLTSIKSPYFVRATIDDSSQVRAIASIFKFFRWRRVVAIYVDNEFGEGFMPFLFDALQDVEVKRSVIPPEAIDDEIQKELRKLMERQARVFVVHMESSLALRVFQIARDIGMMEEGYVWLMTNGMTHMMRHINNGRSLNTIEGVLGVRSHVPKSKELGDFRLRWKRTFEKENPSMRDDLNVFALWAYDSITALAKAVEKANTKSLWYDNGSTLSKNRTDLGNVGVSLYGPSLQKAFSEVRFNGLAGEFKLIDGQLQSPKFEIINFVGNEERIIGFWTPRDGLMDATSSNKKTLGPVIWPGKSKIVPKGWEIPGKKLRVGVPMKKGFFDFVKVTINPITNKKTPTGYAIEIFEAALKELPYLVIPEYVSFESPNNYNNLVYQVYDKTWDAVVGDITITANRSLYADFTLPFTESGVSMMVPVRDNENKDTWVFLEPWSLELWVTTGCFFVFIGFVVWLFEHRVNTDFRGPPQYQIGTSLWFSFSTMVFAHRENVVSNLARFVVVVWCFVVLVLTQSYTASLTSFLTVQSLQPTVTNVNDLIKNRDCVGYQGGAFVKDILLGLGFHEDQLKPFDSAKDADDLLSKGKSKGIAAAFDEVAYLKAILSQSCSKYVMVEPTFKTGGFGFAFPKNSPLTGEFSRAILNLTQNNVTQQIEDRWFPKKNDCPDPMTALSSNRLNLSSFLGLFLIAGTAISFSLLVFVALFLYEHRHTLGDDSEDSLWRKLKFLFKIFDEKDMNSHTFKNSAIHNISSPMTHKTPSPSTVQITPWPQSPSQNREFELRRVSFSPSEERFTTQPIIHHEDGESDIECRVEQ
ncbi:Receptor ligand binding region [Arabidopsis thaliana x Arabidopsis arenosa]|uniref:Glutamate receptor 2.9 n=5 Tax=Arabidopsis TaxID=3701 RepID=GLR29_ARATH|nr:glutamate receptor 2.9 [Arabidopsis thaliana]O81078.1 RecName: Full=Glutamate receptor 2.9; AltName: Full=Ligand-gated ion channel 2.9; Flags: Precursor [Arabidopsis thaliana]AAC33236.1 putative ligand-gated ion channel protein [Arabidopsis thaliana]AEC08211.1 glutamate receptor 2.9 [Arabidopsis thaliana]KAG7637835.1 Receptor ligand binding region [Arabidopsis thaliana x Arabidopsis arenosa]|eukprot:NP_180474.1 glutamate receptor 2.9 [Arabidopsis thaliana]